MDQLDSQSDRMSDFSSEALREVVLERLRQSQETLRSAGILHAAVLGSIARGEAEPDSDVDIVVDLDPAAVIGLVKFVGLQQMLEEIMQRGMDLVSRKGIRNGRGASTLRDAIEVF